MGLSSNVQIRKGESFVLKLSVRIGGRRVYQTPLAVGEEHLRFSVFCFWQLK